MQGCLTSAVGFRRLDRPGCKLACCCFAGLIHYQQNLDCFTASYIITYNSADPGTQVLHSPSPEWQLFNIQCMHSTRVLPSRAVLQQEQYLAECPDNLVPPWGWPPRV